MQMKFSLMIVAAGALALFAGDDAKEKDKKQMEGVWIPAEGEIFGQKVPAGDLEKIRLTLKGDKYIAAVGDMVDEGVCKIDPSTKPKQLDITSENGPNKGKTILAIYEITDDTLRVCYDVGGQARPTDFKTEQAARLLLVYKREKK
jgi:uncharacterized protein (TIGR03067 family)